MNIKNAKEMLARARGNIASAVAWLEQEEFSILEQEISKKKEEEWVNISHEIRAVTTHHMSTMSIEIYHGSKKIGFIDPNGGMNIVCSGYKADWVTPSRWEVYKKWFIKRISVEEEHN